MTFWDKLWAANKPILGLSPMDGVTDAAFRYMVGKYGRPDVMFTEFVSVDALHFASGERRERLLKTFIFDPTQRPVVAQVFGKTPEFFAEAARIIEQLGFDGIDINMGCPAAKIEEQGSGAGLIRTPELAQEIVRTVKGATRLPVSVKTRIGVDQIVAKEWMAALMEVVPANISLHGRTLRQMYTGSANWEVIGEAASVVHKLGGHILGNGDVKSREEAIEKCQTYGVDGVLIGRAAEGNPGVFRRTGEPTREQRLAWAVEHAHKHEEIWGLNNFLPVRKHLAWYCHGFPGAVELRMKLMQTTNASEVEEVIRKQELGTRIGLG